MSGRGVKAFMPFYVSDYLADTMDLTLQEHGAYTLLLWNLWAKDGAISADPARLARMLGVSIEEWESLWPGISGYFKEVDGCLTHTRVTKELERAKDLRRKRAEYGKKGAESRWQKNGENDGKSHGKSHSKSHSKSHGKGHGKGHGKAMHLPMAKTCQPPSPSPSPSQPQPEPEQKPSRPKPPGPDAATEGDPTPSSGGEAGSVDDQVQAFVESWNDWAGRNGRPRARLTRKLQGKVRARIREGLSWEMIAPELDRLSDFALGKTDKWNGVTFYWLTDNEENWCKLQAGNYRRSPARGPDGLEITDEYANAFPAANANDLDEEYADAFPAE